MNPPDRALPMFHRVVGAVFGLLLGMATFASAQTLRAPVITEDEAADHGLTRMWVTQVHVAAARSRVHDIRLEGGTLFVLSDHGAVQAIDAETGASLWYVNVGRPDFPNSGICGSEKFVALCNGGNLYVL